VSLLKKNCVVEGEVQISGCHQLFPPTFWKGEYEFEYNDVTLDSHGGDLINVTETRDWC